MGVIGQASLRIAEFWVLRFRLMVETRSALSGLKHQETRSVDHFAGPDVSMVQRRPFQPILGIS
jgi:hypothetical protein